MLLSICRSLQLKRLCGVEVLNDNFEDELSASPLTNELKEIPELGWHWSPTSLTRDPVTLINLPAVLLLLMLGL